MDKFDYERMGAELVRAIRGRRTQRFLGRKAGFTSNVLHSWETGRSSPTASVLIRLATSGRSDVFPRIARFASSHAPTFDARQLPTPEGLAKFMRELAADEPIAALARAVKSDRTTVTRWLRGRTEPRLPDFLRFVQETTHRVLQFLELFADPAQLKSTAAAFRSLAAQRRIASDLPMSHAVLRALELKAYDRSEAGTHIDFISRHTGIGPSEAHSLLIALEQANLIRKSKGKWHLKHVMNVDTRNTLERDVELKRFWMDQARTRLDAQRLTKTSLFSYNLFAISQHGYEQIRALHLDYYERVRRIVASDANPERVALLNLQLLALDE